MTQLNFLNNKEYSTNLEFFGTDTKEIFQKNLLEQPDDWHYKKHKVNYCFNKQGFRSKYDFDNIDWENSIILLGCSNVQCVGLAEDETLCYHIEQYTGLPVINLGVSGSSIQLSIYNSFVLKNKSKKVKSIIHSYTNLNRFLQFHSLDNYQNHGPWKMSDIELSYFKLFSSSNEIHNMYNRLGFIELWKNVPIFEFTFFDDTAKRLNCKMYYVKDKARDLIDGISHPGKQTIYEISKDINMFLKNYI